MSGSLEEVETIGETHRKALRKARIMTLSALRKRCSTPEGRAEVAEKTGVSEAKLLEWAHLADLARVKGVAGSYAQLLCRAGVRTLAELAAAKPGELAARLADANLLWKNSPVHRLPAQASYARWIKAAAALDKQVS